MGLLRNMLVCCMVLVLRVDEYSLKEKKKYEIKK